MVVKEHVNEAPKKRGRPKGSKNKVKTSNELDVVREKDSKDSEFISKKQGKNKQSDADSVKDSGKRRTSRRTARKEVTEQSPAEQSEAPDAKVAERVETDVVDSEADPAVSSNKKIADIPHDVRQDNENKTDRKSDQKSEPKKNNDGKRKKRKNSTVYVNSIVGMVRYDDSTLNQESEESEEVTEEEMPNVAEIVEPTKEPSGMRVEGVFELSDQSGAAYGFLRQNGISSEEDIYVSPMFVKKFNLKSGELVRGYAKLEQTDRHRPITFVTDVNGVPPYTSRSKCKFDDMTPQFPRERFHLSKSTNDIAMRIIDLIAPVGKGQRGLIVAPPKSGKTILLQKIAKSIKRDYPDVELMILLIDERPEEVTDMKEEVDAAVYYSTFDELPMNHIRIAELVLNRARGLVEMGKDVVILLDSITRLARAYNIAMPASGRTLSGGLDTSALHKPKRFLGSARNMIEGGSLTIMATALIETGSKMDDVIFEEFKGTGNMELILDRKLSEKRIFPSIDIKKSGTRREELLLNREEYEAIMKLRRALDQTSGNEPVELLSEELMRTKDNAELIAWINKVFVDSKFGKMR